MYYICLVCRCSTDVHLPEQLQRAMAAEAEATREARAKVRAKVEELHIKFVDQYTIGVAPITLLRNKNSIIQVKSPYVVKVIFHTIRNCS